MNALDLIVYLVLVLAVWDGWRRGVVLQLCSLAGIVAGIWLGVRWGTTAGVWLGLKEEAAAAGGFVVVLVATMIGVGLAGRLLRRLFRFAGFGLLDLLLGIAVSLLKYLLLLSVLFTALGRLNTDYGFMEPAVIEQSRWFRPVAGLSARLQPYFEQAADRISAVE